jgi:hypothetical protein
VTTIKAGDEVRVLAAQRAEGAARAHYIVIPKSRWGCATAVLGPMTEAEAREKLATYLPLYVAECPPKLLRLVEDYDTTDTEA